MLEGIDVSTPEFFLPQESPEKTAQQLFDELEYDDFCDDAQLLDVLRYLRRSVLLDIPCGWRSSLPDWLV